MDIQPSIKIIGIAVLLSVLWGTGSLMAVEPVDNFVKGALMDIEKYEAQFAGQDSANPGTVNRSLKLLTLTRQRLDSSPNKTHPSWVDADRRYTALIAHLNGLLDPGSSSTAARRASAEKSAADPPSGETSAGAGGSPQMISQYRVRIRKMARDLESAMETLNQAGMKPFQDPAYATRFEASAQRYQEALEAYSDFADDPDVKTAAGKLAEYVNMIAFGRNHAAKELAELGDVQARLKSIEADIRVLKQPATPEEPYQKGELSRWLTQLAQTRQAAVNAHEPLPEIKQRAYLPNNPQTVQEGAPFDFNDVDRLERAVLGLIASIDQELAAFGEHLGLVTRNLGSGLSHFGQFDPADPNDQSNHFLSEGRADEIRARLDQDLRTATEAADFARLINDPSQRDRLTLVREVEATADQYEADYRKAREWIRMPEAATRDSELVSIAKDTLSKYDYLGSIERLVVSTEKTRRTKETSEEEYDNIDVSLSGTVTLTGTRTTYFYEWDEFQVATAETVGGKFYIFYSTLKFFTSGAGSTPLNKWVIGGRFQGPEIPKDNIHK